MIEVRSALRAMGTRFEIVLYGERELYLRTVAEEVFREITRLESRLSYYQESSDITDINLHAYDLPVMLDPPLFSLLELAVQIWAVTEGAFDLTIAPLLECWGFVGGMGKMPSAEAIREALERVGMQHLFLDREQHTVSFDRPDVLLELGAIGKGYAIDQAVEMLRDFEIESALLHGGTSSVYALGTPPDAEAWKVAIQSPQSDELLAEVLLSDMSLSVSAPRHKGFDQDGKRYGHVIDPRTGYPVPEHLLSAVVCPSATLGDALSTALLVSGQALMPVLEPLLLGGEVLLCCADLKGNVIIERGKQESRFAIVEHSTMFEAS